MVNECELYWYFYRFGVAFVDMWWFCHFQLQSFNVEDIKQDYDTGKDNITMVTFKVDFDQAPKLEDALKDNCSRNLIFYKH